jgi:hypothetical protein
MPDDRASLDFAGEYGGDGGHGKNFNSETQRHGDPFGKNPPAGGNAKDL